MPRNLSSRARGSYYCLHTPAVPRHGQTYPFAPNKTLILLANYVAAVTTPPTVTFALGGGGGGGWGARGGGGKGGARRPCPWRNAPCKRLAHGLSVGLMPAGDSCPQAASRKRLYADGSLSYHLRVQQ
ncbi:hypothetical protein C4D60_Mb09t19460 [Musa balbisiana]|uniref:Uncharacterized protein n=1 Tax=Musa balbisiana TaxID=52838 RepID=A0A4S8IHN7_MUSBA|nr:hypothetical protein C4D60_Mb09t19460 [Musa balbisiana]